MAAVSFKKVFLSRFAWLRANPGHARAATDVDVFETFASVYKHHNHFNHFKSKVNILWRTSLWFDI